MEVLTLDDSPLKKLHNNQVYFFEPRIWTLPREKAQKPLITFGHVSRIMYDRDAQSIEMQTENAMGFSPTSVLMYLCSDLSMIPKERTLLSDIGVHLIKYKQSFFKLGQFHINDDLHFLGGYNANTGLYLKKLDDLQ